MNFDFQPVISAVIALIGAIITTVIVPYIRSKTTQQQRDELMKWVQIAVAAAEQLFPAAKSGRQKKAYVQKFLTGQGYDSADPEIDTMIEAAVSKINGVVMG